MKDKAILFIGFRHKKGSVELAQSLGYKAVLLTQNPSSVARELFDEVVEGDLVNVKTFDQFIPDLKEKYAIKGIISNYEHYVVTRSYLGERFNLPSASPYSAACTRNKAMQRHALTFMKENIDYRVVTTQEETEAAFKELGGDIYLKSIAGIKSRLVFHIDEKTEIAPSFKHLKKTSTELDEDLYNDYDYFDFSFEYPNPKKIFIAEKAVHGQQVSVQSLASNYSIWNAPSICDVYSASQMGRKDSFLAFRILPSKFPTEVITKAKNVAETATKILGLRYCPAYTELIITPDHEIKLIEIASRMGGYRPLMYEEAYGINLNKLMVQSVLGKAIKVDRKPKHYVSMLEFFPEKEGVFDHIEQLKTAENDPQVRSFELMVKQGDKVGLAKHNYPPCLRFLLVGKTYQEVYEKSVEYQKCLKVVVK